MSKAGQLWVTKTMLCLQKALVPLATQVRSLTQYQQSLSLIDLLDRPHHMRRDPSSRVRESPGVLRQERLLHPASVRLGAHLRDGRAPRRHRRRRIAQGHARYRGRLCRPLQLAPGALGLEGRRPVQGSLGQYLA